MEDHLFPEIDALMDRAATAKATADDTYSSVSKQYLLANGWSPDPDETRSWCIRGLNTLLSEEDAVYMTQAITKARAK